jgi:hypothetical protein
MSQSGASRSAADLRRLHFINGLFAHATGHNLYLAEQIKSAIAFSLAELEEQTMKQPELADRYDAAFNAAAAALLAKLFADQPQHGFYHLDASINPESATPLFTRAEVMAGLKKLTPYPESTLLITNLRQALLPASKRATARRQKEYEDALAFIRDLAAARTAPTANLHLLFL